MRASAITDQINRGRTAEQVQEISGHLDLRTVMIYVEADQTELLTDMTQDLSRVMDSVPTKVRSSADARANVGGSER